LLKSLRSIAPLISAVCIVTAGSGLLTTKTSLDLSTRHFDSGTVGLLVSGFSLGFLLGCLIARPLISAFGHGRAFQLMAALTALATLIFLLSPGAWVWVAIRIVNGCAMAVIFTAAESWINLVANPQSRGALFSFYMVLNGFGLAAGQAAINLGDPAGGAAYILASSLCLLAVAPFLFDGELRPARPAAHLDTASRRDEKLSFLRSLRIAPISVMAALQAGLTNICFGVMAPIYAVKTGHTAGEAAALVTAFSVGGVLAQIPLGWFSDRFDRRLMLGVMAAAAASSCLAIVWFGQLSTALLLAVALVYGATTLSIYPLAVAFAGSRVKSQFMVALSGQLLFVYALGAIVAPGITNLLMGWISPSALFGFLGSAAFVVALTGFSGYFVAERARRLA